MIIILRDNKIIGVDKKFLIDLNIELNNISNFIDVLNLKINELKKEPILINEKNYTITKNDILSLENIEIYELKETITADNLDISLTQQSKVEEEPTEIKIESPSIQIEESIKPAQPDNLEISLTQQAKVEEEPTEIKIESPSIQIEESIKPSQPESDNLNISLTQQPQVEEEATEIKIESPSIQIEESIKPSQPESDNLNISLTQQPQVEEEIEISFDNELEEIREILSNNKEFENLIHQELQKASEELGIEYKQLTEFYNQLIEQIKEEKKYIYKYISQKNYESLHKSYHKLKGAALNLRLSHLALILKKLDELSKSKEDIEIIKNITDDFYKIIEKNQIKEQHNKKIKINDIILKVIQNYLISQNEANFQRDKKYIEKLLNTKLSSLEELKKIIKG